MADAAREPGTWTFEPLSAEDALECARHMASSEPWITLQRDVTSALAVLRNPEKEVWVARDLGAIAGFIILDLRGPFPGYIQTIYVRPESRSQGLGTALIALAEDRIFRVSPNVFMCVSSFNPAARRLYERLGYSAVGRLRAYVVPEHDEILLRKTRGSWTEFRRGLRR
jgi:ribosomal protein S18 acetylase RimI-like enzyme